MRWLVVGGAGIRHLRALRAIGEQELALIEPDREAAKDAVPIVGKKFIHRDWEDVRKKPDVVVICTPPNEHLADIERATGANIIVEPPLALTLEHREAMTKAVKRERLGIVSCPLRFHPGVQALAAMHQQGAYGDVYLVKGAMANPLTRYAGWRGQRAQAGGLIWDHIDTLDTLRWAFGEPVMARASIHGGMDGADIEAAAHVVLQYQSAIAVLEMFVVQPTSHYRLGLQLVGHKADRPPLAMPAEATDGSGPHMEADAAGWGHACQRQAEHWRDAITGKVDPVQEFMQGFMLVETLQGIYASAAQATGVRFQREAPPAAA